MEVTSVTSKGQVSIAQEPRQPLGVWQGSHSGGAHAQGDSARPPALLLVPNLHA
jgi:hypothetical protein